MFKTLYSNFKNFLIMWTILSRFPLSIHISKTSQLTFRTYCANASANCQKYEQLKALLSILMESARYGKVLSSNNSIHKLYAGISLNNLLLNTKLCALKPWTFQLKILHYEVRNFVLAYYKLFTLISKTFWYN